MTRKSKQKKQQKTSIARKKLGSNTSTVTVTMNPPPERKILKASRKVKPPEPIETKNSQREQGKSVSTNNLSSNPGKVGRSGLRKHVGAKKPNKHEKQVKVNAASQPGKSQSDPRTFQKLSEIRPVSVPSSKDFSACGAIPSTSIGFTSFKIPKKKSETSTTAVPVSSHFSQHDTKLEFENVPYSKSEKSSQPLQTFSVSPKVQEVHDVDSSRSATYISNCDYYDRPPHASQSGPLEHMNHTTDPQSRTFSSPSACQYPKDKSFGEMEEDDMEWETTINEIKSLWSADLGSSVNQKTDNTASEDVDMEIDFEPCSQLVIVPDTNIWIHSLSYIRAVVEKKFPTYSYPTLVIPWMVLQELDFKGKTGGSGRSAISYIHKVLSTSHPRVKGQRAADAAVVNPEFQRMNADDSILQCAQQQQTGSNKVVLITSDRNMKNKALVNGMLVVDSLSGISALTEVLKQNANNNNYEQPKLPVRSTFAQALPYNSPFSKQAAKRRNSDSIDPSKKAKQDSSPSDSTSFQQIISLIEKTLSHVITLKMKEDYGDPDWLNVIKIPPPWVLRSALLCIIKHWQVVFSEVFGRRVSAAEKILNLFQRYKPGSPKELEDDIIDSVIGLFNAGEFAVSDIVRKDEQVRLCRELLLKRMKV